MPVKLGCCDWVMGDSYAAVGELTRVQGGMLLQTAAVLAAALAPAFRPVSWRRTIGNAFAREVLSRPRDWN